MLIVAEAAITDVKLESIVQMAHVSQTVVSLLAKVEKHAAMGHARIH
jgi:hypothetical protein